MTGEFKQCPNGHYYQGDSCPYCKTSNPGAGSRTSVKTEVFVRGGAGSDMPTEDGNSGGINTTVIDGRETVVDRPGMAATGRRGSSNRTVFGDEPEVEYTPAGEKVEIKAYRSDRRLVGWLVSYSFDPMGADNRLYEGKNTIGREVDCNITINDQMMSGHHATLLFRDGQYALRDEMSSHGTFVNGESIGFEPRLLSDGDMIRMGETMFKFRTSF
jgi:hypothetical protein